MYSLTHFPHCSLSLTVIFRLWFYQFSILQKNSAMNGIILRREMRKEASTMGVHHLQVNGLLPFIPKIKLRFFFLARFVSDISLCFFYRVFLLTILFFSPSLALMTGKPLTSKKRFYLSITLIPYHTADLNAIIF